MWPKPVSGKVFAQLKSHRIQVINLLAASAIIAVVVTSMSKAGREAEPQTVIVPVCQVDAGPCEALFDDGGKVELSVRPAPPQAGQPFAVEAKVAGWHAARVEIQFEGVDMNMGMFRETLSGAGRGVYGARITLPVCVTGAMRWNATLMVRHSRGEAHAVFKMKTMTPPPDEAKWRAGVRGVRSASDPAAGGPSEQRQA